MGFDPFAVNRPAEDQGYRELIDKIKFLENRIDELSATIGGQGATYGRSTLHVKGNAIFDGTLSIAEGLIGPSALKNQISIESYGNTVTGWQPATSWATATSISAIPPDWATRAIFLAGGYINPKYNVNAGSPYTYGRIKCGGEYSPNFLSFLGSEALPMGMTWPFFRSSLPRALDISTEAITNHGSVVTGGSAMVNAVAIYMR